MMKVTVNQLTIDDLAELARAAGAQVTVDAIDGSESGLPVIERRSSERRGRRQQVSLQRRPIIPALKF